MAEALLEFARAENATQLVLGASRRPRLAALLSGPGIGSATIRGSGDIDVHLVTHAQIGKGRGLPRLQGSLPGGAGSRASRSRSSCRRCSPSCWPTAASQLNLVSDVLLFLLVVVVVALVGGFLPAMLAAVSGSLLLNYYFAPPLHTLTIRETNNVLAIGVFIVVAALVSSVVDLAARRTRQAARATAESETLGTLAGSVLRGETALPALLERVREAFGLTSVTLLERTAPQPRPSPARARPCDDWTVVASAGLDACKRPEDADTEVPAGDTCMLALRGRPLRAEDQRLVGAFAAQAAVILERHRLSEAAAAAVPHRRGRPDAHGPAGRRRPRPAHPAGLGEGSRDQPAQRRRRVVRRGPRRAAAHGRRVPRPARPAGGQPARHEPAAGRGAVGGEPLGRARRGGAAGARRPRARSGGRDDRRTRRPAAGAGRSRAARAGHRQPGRQRAALQPRRTCRPRSRAAAWVDRVELRVIDRGPGIPPTELDRVFAPFQRLGDTDNTTGVGLGLACPAG